MLPITIFALLGLTALLINTDVTDDVEPDETIPVEPPETAPVDSIYDEPEIDPETGAFLLSAGQTVMGTDGDDIFNLAEDADTDEGTLSITAGAGNDIIDLKHLGVGALDIDAGDGDDLVDVGAWYGTTIQAGAGDDRITIHNNGAALVNGGDGDDYITSDTAFTDHSTFYGGAGADTIDARDMDNVGLFGGEGDDVLMTSQHAPSGNGYWVEAFGGEGEDRLIHEAPEQGYSSGRPTLFGGEDSDSFEITIRDSGSDPTIWDPSPGAMEQSDVVILGDFDRAEDTLQITLDVSDPGYTVTSAEIVEEPYRESVDASGTPVYGTETHINVNYEHDMQNDRQMTIVVRATGLTWDDITFIGDNIPPVLTPLI